MIEEKKVTFRLHATLRHFMLNERGVRKYTIVPSLGTSMARVSSQCLRTLIHWEGENAAKCIFQLDWKK
jgi:hypothetical protein